ncbi:hypothetical protein DFH11DRAFT_1734629 [Phellopilus nigrolimitatus]|nr:hypothetical protein DFH11DRAFT_1734629 [Phellopilus nigrolimitatus]
MSASDPASWAPPGESPAALWEERSNFAGVVLASAAYGVHLTLFLFVLQHLLQHPAARGAAKPRVSWGLVAYISWNFVLGTLGIAAEARFNQLTFIDARNYPGGPNAFVAAQYGDFVNIFGTSAYVVLNWFADGLVIYRFWLIYNFNYYIAFVPCLLLLGSVSMGIILLFQLTQPFANLWSTTAVNFGIPYWSLSAGLNVLVTALIVARLFLIRARTRAVLSTHHARTYTGVAAMLVESAALYSAAALVFVVAYARGSNVQNLVLPLLGQVQAVAPLLIMWRVARGQAIDREALLTSSAAMTPSKLSWRRSVSATTTTMSDTGSGAGSRVRLGLRAQSVCLPPRAKGGASASVLDAAFDADAEAPWELAERKLHGGGGGGGCVEVVVAREVERWDADGRGCAV